MMVSYNVALYLNYGFQANRFSIFNMDLVVRYIISSPPPSQSFFHGVISQDGIFGGKTVHGENKHCFHVCKNVVSGNERRSPACRY
jgi:hypothetical protein